MKKLSILMVLVIALSLSCKKTVESEKKSFDYNKKKIEKLGYEFPSFKKVLQEQVKKAEAVFKSADSIKDEEGKIKKMAEANSMLSAGFIRNLEQIRDIKKKLKSTIVDVKGLKLDYSERMGANRAVSDADEAVMKSEDKLKGEVNTASEAESLSSLVLSDLKSAKTDLDRIVSKVREKEKKIAAEKKAAEVSKQKEEVKKVEAAKPVKCGYCGTLNPPTNTKCKSCGAPLTKK